MVAKRLATSRKRKKTVAATDAVGPGKRSSDAVASQVAEYVGASLGKLLNRRDQLLAQVADLDRRIAAAGRVASTIAERLPGLSALPGLAGLRRRPAVGAKKGTARTERKGNRKKHRGKPDLRVVPKETLKKMSAAATARTAARKRPSARSSR